jgi:DNA-binding HxlR family transcriptional regulator
MPRRSSAPTAPHPIVPLLAYQADPLRESVRRFGRRWTLLLLRDMAFLRLARFNQLLRNNPGLTPRVLSRRLKEMLQEGLVVRHGSGRDVRYGLTERGSDAVYILLAFLRYGMKYYASPPATAGAVRRPAPGRP